MRRFRYAVAFLALTSAAATFAQSILVTPGSLANYTYITPASGSGSSSGTSENVSTLQRCYWSPVEGDKQVDLSTKNWYGQTELSVYYKAVGGDGGLGGYNGFGAAGGGGSSAILKNGSLVAAAKGGDGGKVGSEVSGVFKITKTDSLRFITGGSGGGASCTADANGTSCIGGGGGAGYRGGGAGASVINASTKAWANTEKTGHGLGGSDKEGLGGYILSADLNSGSTYPGTAGIGENGGVVSYKTSAAQGTTWRYGSWTDGYYGYSSYTANHPAKKNSIGSIQGPFAQYINEKYVTYWFGGGGGQLGSAGMSGLNNPIEHGNYVDWYNAGVSVVVQNKVQYTHLHKNLSMLPQPTSFTLDRTYPPSPTCAPLANPGIPCTHHTGSPPGRIVLMYQAETCDLLN